MKNIFIATLLLIFTGVSAQVRTPAMSPNTLVKQTIGLTEVELEYNRPSMRGRAVFGDLVPFGRLWRTGANKNTMVTFGDDVVIDGKTLPKGKYAIFANPRADNWEVFFYTDTENWGTPEKWDDAKVALKVNVKPQTISNTHETFTVGINHISTDAAHLEISWEKTLAAIRFEVPTKKLAMASIDKALAGPSASDYFAAAQYLYNAKEDNAKALEYVNKACTMTEEKGTPFWYNRMKSLIQFRAGDKKGAIETAKKSLADSEKAGNADYVKMNKDSIAEWSK
jgi:hypothetical protein